MVINLAGLSFYGETTAHHNFVDLQKYVQMKVHHQPWYHSRKYIRYML